MKTVHAQKNNYTTNTPAKKKWQTPGMQIIVLRNGNYPGPFEFENLYEAPFS
ncbi:hypothetical protein [Emticicia fluvialis]|uniref:hypothetical protein n=1 Tax=Emticicia fluvialis TaxID=2974474 RepID=UPI0021655208|nr:hypothetical protein [Emticicia fluvialis]